MSLHQKAYTVTLGINNLFDKDPPFWNDGTVNTNEYTYDVVGRYIFLNLRADVGKLLGNPP
jgi:outer membrane receptor protein involved in Fe transport